MSASRVIAYGLVEVEPEAGLELPVDTELDVGVELEGGPEPEGGVEEGVDVAAVVAGVVWVIVLPWPTFTLVEFPFPLEEM